MKRQDFEARVGVTLDIARERNEVVGARVVAVHIHRVIGEDRDLQRCTMLPGAALSALLDHHGVLAIPERDLAVPRGASRQRRRHLALDKLPRGEGRAVRTRIQRRRLAARYEMRALRVERDAELAATSLVVDAEDE